MSDLSPALETHGLRKLFGDLVAVDGIDLTVPRGSFDGFLGPNGAGKSTTIKCMTGLLAPTAGTYRILDLDPLRDPVAVKRKVGVVPEDLALFDRLSGAETLAFVGRVHGLATADVRSRSTELLQLMDLERALAVRPGADLLDPPLRDDAAVGDDADVRRQALDDLENVRGQKDRSAARHKRQQQILDLP